jgi:hypothetical protein
MVSRLTTDHLRSSRDVADQSRRSTTNNLGADTSSDRTDSGRQRPQPRRYRQVHRSNNQPDIDFYLLAQTKGFFFSILFRSFTRL